MALMDYILVLELILLYDTDPVWQQMKDDNDWRGMAAYHAQHRDILPSPSPSHQLEDTNLDFVILSVSAILLTALLLYGLVLFLQY